MKGGLTIPDNTNGAELTEHTAELCREINS